MKVSRKTVAILLDHFLEKEPENLQLPPGSVFIPNRESSPDAKLFYILRKIDERFKSGLFCKVDDPMINKSEIVKKSCPLPSIAITGEFYEYLTINATQSFLIEPFRVFWHELDFLF